MVSRIWHAWCLLILPFLLALAGPARGETPAASLEDGRTGKTYFESWTPAGFGALARRDLGPKTVVFGTLRLPKDAASRAPAMVIAHGSSGSSGVDTREGEWADRLGKLGMATFVVDSFTPRNIRSTGTDQTQLSTAANVADALAALHLLATHPRIDPDHIGIIGFSKGGQVAFFTELEPLRRAVVERITHGPLLFLLGGRDDYTSAEPCRAYAEWFKSVGAETTVIVYPDSYHDFDSSRPPKVERALVNGRKCEMSVDLDHFKVKVRSTGEDITASAIRYARECLSRGATVGGDAEARRRAPEDVAQFLHRTLAP